MISLLFLGFCCIVFAVFLIGSTVLIVAIFVYGLYCILRDLGFLDTLFEKIGTFSSYVSDHCKQNVEDSFLFEPIWKNLPGRPASSVLGRQGPASSVLGRQGPASSVLGRQGPASSVLGRQGPALFLGHPHGLYGLTWFIHFAISLSKWPLEERPVLAIHSVFFHLPIFRELVTAHNCIEAKEETIVKTLREGKSVALLVGGIEELHLTSSGPLQLVLKKRSGYARISQTCQVPLIPLVCPEENQLFPAIQTPLWKWFQQVLYDRWRIAIPIPSWTSVWSWTSIAYKPFSTPLVTYILDPVYPDEKSIEDIKSEYEQRLVQFSKDYSIPLDLLS